MGQKVNKDKARVGLSKTIYLGYTIYRVVYSPEDYTQGQILSLPSIKSKKELQRILGIMNIYRGVCLGFGSWVKGLYGLTSKEIPIGIQDRIQEIWKKILENQQQIYKGRYFGWW